jgi:hypothetical protein
MSMSPERAAVRRGAQARARVPSFLDGSVALRARFVCTRAALRARFVCTRAALRARFVCTRAALRARRSALGVLSVLLLQSLGLVGCASHPKPAPVAVHHDGLCFLSRERAAFAQSPRAHDWVRLLVQLELGQGGVFALRDCTGSPIRWEPRAGGMCPGENSELETPSPAPISRDSVIERSLGGGYYLLWVVSHRFANGDGFGPLALARRVPTGIEVDALGGLRMRTERVNLERWMIRGEAVVVASGESCTHAGTESCQRAARLLVHKGSALLDPPLLDPTGHCLQEASIEMARHHEQTLPSGLQRSFELTSAISHDARFVVIEERLVVRDIDPSSPSLPPREVQHVEANRFVHVQGGHLFSKQHALWGRALSQAESAPQN